jgi:hypothetical protein
VGASEELDALLKDREFVPYSETRRRWVELCVCGHVAMAHSPSIGGSYALPEATETGVHRFHGCRGELRRGQEPAETFSREDDRAVHTLVATCVCEQFRPVARVDRPGRYFNQRRPTDRDDLARHPFLSGMRAFRTRISRFKTIAGDPKKTAREFDKRFEWLDRSCASCGATGSEVWPVFVDPVDHSELRCPAHR